MKELIFVFGGAFALMLIGFAIDLAKAYVCKFIYHRNKRKAIEQNSPDKWIYKI
jgi:hypothetical protein